MVTGLIMAIIVVGFLHFSYINGCDNKTRYLRFHLTTKVFFILNLFQS